jgi:hypothetical protein
MSRPDEESRKILEALGITISTEQLVVESATLSLRPGSYPELEVRYLLKPLTIREDAQGVLAVLKTFKLKQISEEYET